MLESRMLPIGSVGPFMEVVKFDCGPVVPPEGGEVQVGLKLTAVVDGKGVELPYVLTRNAAVALARALTLSVDEQMALKN